LQIDGLPQRNVFAWVLMLVPRRRRRRCRLVKPMLEKGGGSLFEVTAGLSRMEAAKIFAHLLGEEFSHARGRCSCHVRS
jgi:hypothetical protein